ncbi:MAG: tetratricopeptide repeat protein, partial [Pseudomonadales bacterium]
WCAYITGGKPSEIYPKAKTAALRALELDAGLAEAHSALGHIRFAYDWDWAGAEDAFKRAIALNPNSAAAHHQYSIYLGNVGRLEEAIAVGEQSVRVDPLSVAASQALGLLFVLAQQYDEGRIHLERALDLDPNFPVARVCLAVLHVKTQMPEKAIKECERAVSASRGAAGPQAMLGYTYAVAHRTEEARSVLATLESLAESQYVSAAYIAFPHIGLGEHDEAFRWLDTAFAERAGALTWLPTWPVYDSLREDPRFSRLLQRMGLEG